MGIDIIKNWRISIHALREEGDGFGVDVFFNLCNFYPRPPRGGRQPRQRNNRVRHRFLSTPSARRATQTPSGAQRRAIFLSTPSARRATSSTSACAFARVNFYPRPPRGGRLSGRERPLPARPYFYPRPPRGGRQSASASTTTRSIDFYPRPPRGGRPDTLEKRGWCNRFLSTPSARRATWKIRRPPTRHTFLSTPSARRATPFGAVYRPGHCISIHALREEGDSMPSPALILPGVFLSTPSARRATLTDQTGGRVWWISIHALREEGDVKHTASSEVENIFLSTPSARRATFGGVMVIATIIISIHALREEGDIRWGHGDRYYNHFYPRPPRGGRRA